MTRSAFVGTNPTGELMTSGLPVIRPETQCQQAGLKSASIF
jgi:hypothetical protein